MPTECSAELFEFARVEGRCVVAAFDGGKITSDAGALLLGASDRAIGLIDRLASCFTDSRSPEQVEHTVATMVGQRVFGIALGYEDVVDHDELRHDPMQAVLAGKLAARRKNCAPVAGKSTLTRISQCAPTARITSGGGFHPDSSRFDLVAGKRLGGVIGRAEALRQRPPWAVEQSDGP